MIDSFTILTPSKQILCHETYNFVAQKTVDTFIATLASSASDLQEPYILIEDSAFYFVEANSLTFAVSTKLVVPHATLFQFLYSVVTALQSFLKKLSLSELVKNKALALEVLNEAMHFGYPQNTATDVLDLFVLSGKPAVGADYLFNAKMFSTESTTRNVFRKNESTLEKNAVYVTVLEKLFAVYDANKELELAKVEGICEVDGRFLGTPKCDFSVTKKFLEKQSATKSFSFHSSVDLDVFNKLKQIRFVPPEGLFKLLTYNTPLRKTDVPFELSTVRRKLEDGSGVSFEVSLFAKFPELFSAKDVKVLVPAPADTKKCSLTGPGRLKYKAAKQLLEVYLGKIKGLKSLLFIVSVKSVAGVSSGMALSRPVELVFRIPYFTPSTFIVENVNILGEENWSVEKWITYRTIESKIEARYV